MVGTRGADCGEPLECAAAGELERFGVVGEMADPRPAHQPAQERHHPGGGGATLVGGEGGVRFSTKCRSACEALIEVCGGIGDEGNAVVVTGLRAVAPADDAMAREHHAAQAGMGGDIIAQLQAEVEPRPLPRQPADRAAPDLARRRFAAGRRRQRNDRIGVNVVDMSEGKVGMERGVDRGCAGVKVEGAMGEIGDHLVLMLDPAIQLLQT